MGKPPGFVVCLVRKGWANGQSDNQMAESAKTQQNSKHNQSKWNDALHHCDYLIAYPISQALKGVSLQ